VSEATIPQLGGTSKRPRLASGETRQKSECEGKADAFDFLGAPRETVGLFFRGNRSAWSSTGA
jgi:hypothetical protein